LLTKRDTQFLTEIASRYIESFRSNDVDSALHEMRLTPLLSEAFGQVSEKEAKRLADIAGKVRVNTDKFLKQMLDSGVDKTNPVIKKIIEWQKMLPDEGDIVRLAYMTGKADSLEREKLMYKLIMATSEAPAYESALIGAIKFLAKKLEKEALPGAEWKDEPDESFDTIIKSSFGEEKKALETIFSQLKTFYKRPKLSASLAQTNPSKLSKFFKGIRSIGNFIKNPGALYGEFVRDIASLTPTELVKISTAVGNVDLTNLLRPAQDAAKVTADDVKDAKGEDAKGEDAKGEDAKGKPDPAEALRLQAEIEKEFGSNVLDVARQLAVASGGNPPEVGKVKLEHIRKLAATRLNELGLRPKRRLENTIDVERWSTLAGIKK
jgi:hypothetical protein